MNIISRFLKINPRSILVLVILTSLCILEFSALHSLNKSFRVWFLDVGQADGILIQTPDMHYVLVDCGVDQEIQNAIERVLPFGISTIDMILLTHPDADHIGGLPFVLNKYQVKQVVFSSKFNQKEDFITYLNYINTKHINSSQLFRYDSIIFNNTIFDILWPTSGYEIVNDNYNDLSLVIRVTYGASSFLLTGDASANILEEVSKQNRHEDTILLKASHHGSKTGTSLPFLEQIRPGIIVYSVGKDNKFKHPSQEILDMASKAGLYQERTDVDGDIEVRCDSANCYLRR